ncbi:hypothetical protein J2X69_004171 [Algoriphagus sp. 4150]|uniref:fibronectin type III domain-containing protein n=1 Tax=Algoriphagus sp. 4150 TaxID=2817756 RepID=UPI0028579FE6|nr:hypothetical protein [Algoriphagus sp. 4150]MDR7131806.1 hypothetical protein [Algoriphagus sp. 4150]
MHWFLNRLIISLAGILFMTGSAIAQQIHHSPHIIPGPERTVLLVQAIAFEHNPAQLEQFLKPGERLDIFRADGNSTEFKKIGSTQFPASAAELEKKLGDEFTSLLLDQLNVNSVKEAYSVLLQSTPDILGMALLAPEIMEVFGMMYTDRDREPTVSSHYRVDYISGSGESTQSTIVEVESKLPLPDMRFLVENFLVSDSAASINWYSRQEQYSELPLFATIYRRTGVSGEFDPVKQLYVMQDDLSDSSRVHFNEEIPSGSHLAYYLRVEDFAGNMGPASDTLYTLSVDISQLEGISNLQVADTTGGLLLTWDPLPRQAVYNAIQILKSRELGADYVVVDTIASTEISYLDGAVIPASSYYYKVRPLIYNLPGSDPLVYAEANGHKSMSDTDPLPVTPQNIQASVTPEGIRVSWQQGDELNLFGYYVLRGTSAANLGVISQPIQDTVFVDSLFAPGFSGQLHYAVQVVDLSQNVSDTSALASVTITQPVILTPVGGIQSRRTVDGVVLQWEDVLQRDNIVEGYFLYRRIEGEENYRILNTSMLRLPFYTDSTASPSSSYEYAVTSVDSWGNQSILSPISSIDYDIAGTLLPPRELYLRNMTKGIEISWPEVLEDPAIQYVIYRKSTGQERFEKIATTLASNVYLDEAVQQDRLYEYSISATAGENEGNLSVAKAIRRQ